MALLTKKKGVAMVVLDMPLLDTRNTRDLSGHPHRGYCPAAAFLCRAEGTGKHPAAAGGGIAAAKERGVRFGRPEKEIPGRFFSLR